MRGLDFEIQRDSHSFLFPFFSFFFFSRFFLAFSPRTHEESTLVGRTGLPIVLAFDFYDTFYACVRARARASVRVCATLLNKLKKCK